MFVQVINSVMTCPAVKPVPEIVKLYELASAPEFESTVTTWLSLLPLRMARLLLSW
jgi:hypothetical protein